jgi:nitrogen fixation-related uncharacterized protein
MITKETLLIILIPFALLILLFILLTLLKGRNKK